MDRDDLDMTAAVAEDDLDKTAVAADDDERTGVVEEPSLLEGNPGLPVASLIFGVAAAILGLFVSWIPCVIVSIIAIALGAISMKQQAPRLILARIGLALGVVCIVASVVLVGVVIYQLASIGLL